MKTTLLFVTALVLSSSLSAQTRHARRTVAPNQSPGAASSNLVAAGQSLPIRRVILYSNGVAYIERRGTITGQAEISLSFKQSQVDDVLKSMIVLDLGKGRIGAVSYNSSAPPSARMAEIPFAISSATDGNNNGGLAGVLGQLQGARVVVTAANRTAAGSILTVEEQHSQIDADKPPVVTHRLVIASDTGELSRFDLNEVRSIQLVDEGARRDVTEFAHAAASARRRDAKTIVVTSDGAGRRELVVSYTIAAPIWKTTYRVVLDNSGKPFFQGWAIVDNVSDEDWNEVQLSLVSGTPVSFIQPIQNPVYRYRPVVPMPEDLNLRPQVYEPGEGGVGTGSLNGRVTDPNGAVIAGASVEITNQSSNQTYATTTNNNGIYRVALPAGNYSLNISAAGFKNAAMSGLQVNAGTPSSSNVSLEVGNVSETVTVTASDKPETSVRRLNELPVQSRNYANNLMLTAGVVAGDRLKLSEAITSGQSGIEAEATGSEVGDLFEYRIDQPVTVPRERSALIPILQTRMDGERVSIFNEEGRKNRPMSGLLLKNTSALTLENGSLTVVDGEAYAGEALIERLKPSEQRLISFALDLATLVTVSEKEDRAPTFLVRAVNGVFQAHYYQTNKKSYTLTNQTDNPRVVYIEHPVQDDWTLADDTAKPEIQTARYYRFRVKLEAHQKLEFPVTERQELMETYALSDFTRRELELFITRNYIDAQTRAALEKIIDLKSRIAAAQERLQKISSEATEISQDQQRLRENIKALTATAEAKQLISRYVAKANEQETRLEQLGNERRTVNEEQVRLQAELDAAIRGLSLNRSPGS
jgi:hypothetical protein